MAVERCAGCGRKVTRPVASCTHGPPDPGTPPDPRIGTVFAGRYLVLAALADGGMARVYLARHTVLDGLVALKVLRADLGQDAVQRDRFFREARAIHRIADPHVVTIHDAGVGDDGALFLAMEYVRGITLRERLAAGALDPLEVLDVAEQVAHGLGRAHARGVIHRDLKPDNVIVSRRSDGSLAVKLLDFGIAKLLDQPGLTAADRIFGTPGYIAPEYIAGAAIDARADFYSLGAVLYELVTGALPFDFEYPNDLLVKHLHDAPVPPRQRLATVPAPLEALVLRALAKRPERRFRDAGEFVAAVREVRREITSGEPIGSLETTYVGPWPAADTALS